MSAITASLNASLPNSSAAVRVYLPTYQRRSLLPRAVAALQAQTHVQWICEVHNDDPDDPFPGELVRTLGDPRIRLFTHPKNLGPIASFNLFYRATAEPFYALLEDDNSWDPTFLATLVEALEREPTATLAWCNQRVIEEQPGGVLRDSGQLVNPPNSASPAAQWVAWGQWRQATGAVHANGAMLIRSRPGQTFPTPDIPFGGVEAFRERLLPHPLIYLPQVLASYTVTQRTARAHDLGAWGAYLVALAATFLRHAQLNTEQSASFWKYFSDQRPPMTNELIASALICPEARPLLRQARGRDWLRFTRSCARRPATWWHTLRVRREHPEWWKPLDQSTAERFAERNAAAPFHS